MTEKIQSDWIDPSFNVRNPADPTDLLMSRAPRPPDFFKVEVDTDGDLNTLVFTIGYTFRTPFTPATYTVYFTTSPGLLITAVNQASLVTNVGGAVVGSVAAIQDGSRVMLDNRVYFSQRGYFFVVATNGLGLQSLPSTFIASPALKGIVTNTIPPNFTSAAISKKTVVVNNTSVSRIQVSAAAPRNNRGVIGVLMTNFGSGYTSTPTVAFSGGLSSDGVAATGSAVMNTDGTIQAVLISSAGKGYIAPPQVTFTGGGGTGAQATAILGDSTAVDGYQMYLTNYRGGGQVEGPFFTIGSALAGSVVTGTFDLIPDGGHTTTFTYVAVSQGGVRSTSGAPTTTLIV